MMNLFDAYEIRARLFPAIIIVSPLIIPIIPLMKIFNMEFTEAVYIIAIFFAVCYLIAMKVRFLSKEKVKDLVKEWGGLPSTQLMLNTNSVFHTITKNTLRKKIDTEFGIKITPSSENEEVDIYESFRLVRARLRDEKSLTFKQNCEYGFLRNLYGGYVWWLWITFISLLSSGGLIIYDASNLHILALSMSVLYLVIVLSSSRKVQKKNLKKAAFIYAETAWTEYYHLKNN